MGLLQADRRSPLTKTTGTYAGQTAEDLRLLLRRHGITNRELAQACRRSESWVGKRVNGQIPIDLDDLELFARALGVEPAELLPRAWAPAGEALTGEYVRRGHTGTYVRAPGATMPAPRLATGGHCPSPVDAGHAPPSDYKFHSSRSAVTHRSDIAAVRPLLPRRRCAVPTEPRKAAA